MYVYVYIHIHIHVFIKGCRIDAAGSLGVASCGNQTSWRPEVVDSHDGPATPKQEKGRKPDRPPEVTGAQCGSQALTSSFHCCLVFGASI